MFNHLLPDAIEAGPLLVCIDSFLRYPQGFAFYCVLHFFTDFALLRSIVLLCIRDAHIHTSRFSRCVPKVRAPDRAMAIIRPGAALIETAGGLSDQYHEWITVTGYPGLLTITKECKEREYRGMTAGLFAPLARVHAASGPGCQTVQYCLALRLSNGVGSAE